MADSTLTIDRGKRPVGDCTLTPGESPLHISDVMLALGDAKRPIVDATPAMDDRKHTIIDIMPNIDQRKLPAVQVTLTFGHIPLDQGQHWRSPHHLPLRHRNVTLPIGGCARFRGDIAPRRKARHRAEHLVTITYENVTNNP